MNGMRALTLCFVVLSLAGLGMAQVNPIPCTPVSITSAPAPGAITGTVRNKVTGKAVLGALINWTSGKQAMSGMTDVNGAYAFQVPVTGSGAQSINLAVQANLYNGQSASAEICPGSTNTLNIGLTPESAAEVGVVQGHVFQTTGSTPVVSQGLPGAAVSILLGGFIDANLSATTDQNGAYEITGVGFATGLSIQVTTEVPPCVTAVTRPITVDRGVVNEDFSLPLVWTKQLRCPPVETGPEPTPPTSEQVQVPSSTPSATASRFRQLLQRLLGVRAAHLPDSTSSGTPRASVLARPELATDSSIQWQLATNNGILTNASQNAWNAGHVEDILLIAPSQAVVGTNTGGVWSLEWNSTTAAALPLSTNWTSTNITSVVQGPDGSQHVYAGTWGFTGNPGGVVFETDTSSADPLLNWTPHSLPACSQIQHILVIDEVRRIVVACDKGIWWSSIPAPPSAQGVYHWQQAIPAPGLSQNALTGQFGRLAKGPGWAAATSGPPQEGTIVAAAFGGTVPSTLIFYGGWAQNGQLVLKAANVSSANVSGGNGGSLTVGRTSVAACPANPSVMYAVSDAPNSTPSNLIAAVWSSVDGGQNWRTVTTPTAGNSDRGGNQGNYNQAIAVSPAACNIFALGWRDHTFVSYDSGNSFVALDDGGGGQLHLHSDYHAVAFDPFDPQTLFIGSDGGIVSAKPIVQSGTPAFTSFYNAHLPNLQFYHATASSRSDFLVAGALQDNGVAYSEVIPGAGWWQKVAESDGVQSLFVGVGGSTSGVPLQNDVLAWADSADETQWSRALWNGSQLSRPNQDVIPVADSHSSRDPVGLDAASLPSPAAIVSHPAYANAAGQLMYQVMAQGVLVYGLFANPDDSDLHWEFLGPIGLGQNATAVSSFNGTTIFVGTDHGNIYLLSMPFHGTAVQLAIDPPNGGVGQINSIIELTPSLGFAATNNGYVLNFLGQAWQALGGGLPTSLPFVALAAPDLGSLFAATHNAVYVSHDLGSSWLGASSGLPTVANAYELQFVVQPDNTRYLYLATYGWSVFRAVVQ